MRQANRNNEDQFENEEEYEMKEEEMDDFVVEASRFLAKLNAAK